MALTEDRMRTEQVSPIAPASVPKTALTRRRVYLVLGAWVVLLPLGVSLEPTPASNTAPWWSYVVSFALLGAMCATFAGLAQRRSWGAGASVIASSIFVAGVFACPATGHHAFGLWWFGEFAAALTLLSVSAVAYVRSR